MGDMQRTGILPLYGPQRVGLLCLSLTLHEHAISKPDGSLIIAIDKTALHDIRVHNNNNRPL